jgi:hypothetical protein
MAFLPKPSLKKSDSMIQYLLFDNFALFLTKSFNTAAANYARCIVFNKSKPFLFCLS